MNLERLALEREKFFKQNLQQHTQDDSGSESEDINELEEALSKASSSFTKDEEQTESMQDVPQINVDMLPEEEEGDDIVLLEDDDLTPLEKNHLIQESIHEIFANNYENPLNQFTELEIPEEDIDDFEENEYLKSLQNKVTDPELEENYFYEDGKPRLTRREGTLEVTSMQLDDILIRHTIRDLSIYKNLSRLEKSIEMHGLLKPVLVLVNDDNEYELVDGLRRIEVFRNKGIDTIPVIVDHTLIPDLLNYYRLTANQMRQKYFLDELMTIGRRIEENSIHFHPTTFDVLMGLNEGDYMKMKDIQSYNIDPFFADVDEGKMTILAAWKKMERKRQKEREQTGEGTEDIAEYDLSPNLQSTSEREPLPFTLRRIIEDRDGKCCQACGFGYGSEEYLSFLYEVHHLTPVWQEGEDIEENLILLCRNCHTLVHKIAEQPKLFQSERARIDYTNAIALANIILNGKQFYVKRSELTQFEHYIENRQTPWLLDAEIEVISDDNLRS
ncbi:ParB N-terminal domain-containing protein [Bacillus subtilis]|uniref:HNH endonuclease n=1 Tax=Bacillus subtilis group TaxID=653685 RepID=UPI001CFA1EC3|nr:MULTISPECIES: ParB N-terminal domain-containing protein [Bacillus subtilis group]MCT6515352.1 ParB N-terminal domain-containing protein [Bacillus subtilis]MDK7656888.1 ParB N-terminal domain-containing protein [Bacillus subtilis]MDQ4711698.1 ParB N-terminal domain-containing protein [Bacillus subtilis]MEC0325376.1 ParB N-terminal domain-containing protein [Bacillus subtilis]MEC0392618.1 ParB N-terminal domain-containing protein [Bacillus subtilis]